MNIKVSVIVPVYNVKDYLRECLDSLVKQTLQEIEIIAVDDGSTDESPSILEEYQRDYPNVQVITKKNGGLSSARNAGLDAAKGKYIYYLDSDDYIDYNGLEILYHKAEEDQTDLLLCDGKAFYDDGKERKSFIERDYVKEGNYSGIYPGYKLFCKLLENQDYRTQVSLQFVKREILEQHQLKFVHGILHEDHPYTFELFLLCDRVEAVKQTIFHRRFRDGSIMSSKTDKRNFLGFARVYREMLSTFKKHRIEGDYQKIYKRYLGDIFGVTMIHLYYSLNTKEQKETKDTFKKIIRLTKAENCFQRKKVFIICYGYPVYGIYKKIRSLADVRR